MLILYQQVTIHLEHLIVQTTEHCFTQMELNQLQLKQLVLQQLNGVNRIVWNVGKVGFNTRKLVLIMLIKVAELLSQKGYFSRQQVQASVRFYLLAYFFDKLDAG